MLAGVALYQKAAPVIKYGVSRRFGDISASWRHPQGWQAVVRTSADLALVVIHTFADSPDEMTIPLSGEWEIVDRLGDTAATVADQRLLVKPGGDFSGSVFLLKPR